MRDRRHRGMRPQLKAEIGFVRLWILTGMVFAVGDMLLAPLIVDALGAICMPALFCQGTCPRDRRDRRHPPPPREPTGGRRQTIAVAVARGRRQRRLRTDLCRIVPGNPRPAQDHWKEPPPSLGHRRAWSRAAKKSNCARKQPGRLAPSPTCLRASPSSGSSYSAIGSRGTGLKTTHQTVRVRSPSFRREALRWPAADAISPRVI